MIPRMYHRASEGGFFFLIPSVSIYMGTFYTETKDFYLVDSWYLHYRVDSKLAVACPSSARPRGNPLSSAVDGRLVPSTANL